MSRQRSRRARGGGSLHDAYGGRRKVSQLCHQVSEVLSLSLASSADQALHQISIVSVVPAPDASRLLVTVAHDDPENLGESLADTPGALTRLAAHREWLAGKLESARGYLRSEIAGAIHRKRTPDLAFRVIDPLRR